MTAPKKRPELELGPLFVMTAKDYLGRQKVNALTSDQAIALSNVCNHAAHAVARILENGEAPQQLLGLDDD